MQQHAFYRYQEEARASSYRSLTGTSRDWRLYWAAAFQQTTGRHLHLPWLRICQFPIFPLCTRPRPVFRKGTRKVSVHKSISLWAGARSPYKLRECRSLVFNYGEPLFSIVILEIASWEHACTLYIQGCFVHQHQRVTRRCRLSWLTNSAQVQGEGGCWVSASEYSCAYGAKIKLEILLLICSIGYWFT